MTQFSEHSLRGISYIEKGHPASIIGMAPGIIFRTEYGRFHPFCFWGIGLSVNMTSEGANVFGWPAFNLGTEYAFNSNTLLYLSSLPAIGLTYRFN